VMFAGRRVLPRLYLRAHLARTATCPTQILARSRVSAPPVTQVAMPDLSDARPRAVRTPSAGARDLPTTIVA
jgi:hypothetical protein